MIKYIKRKRKAIAKGFLIKALTISHFLNFKNE